jgi:hypothetical protein
VQLKGLELLVALIKKVFINEDNSIGTLYLVHAEKLLQTLIYLARGGRYVKIICKRMP